MAIALVLAGSTALTAGADAQSRYELQGGCYALKSQSLGRYVAREGDAYRASAAARAQAEPFRMQATRLGQYLLYGRARDFLTAAPGGAVHSAPRASEEADWRVSEAGGGAFRVVLPRDGRGLAVDPAGNLVTAAGGAAFAFEPTAGCPQFPEVEVNATGEPARGATAYGETRGMLETHMHWMAYEFMGGRVHCARPWHPWGVEHALVDCPDHYPSGAAASEAVLSGGRATHDPVGWPTFRDWPAPRSLTHEQSYYRWVERAWRSGLRVFVNLAADNGAVCEVYPLKQNSCREMDSALLQIQRLRELEDYVDAQNGGPGKGWFRIVTDPFQARRVVNQGKLAVIMGIEVSRLFDCRIFRGVPQCDKATIDRQLDQVHRLGVRDLQLINKFDNALAGVAGDSGSNGVVTTNGHVYETGRYPDFQTCTGPDADEPQISPAGGRDQLLSNAFDALLPPGSGPLYPAAPHCNTRGLTELGQYLVRRMIEKKMIVDPDHLSVLSRSHLLSIAEAHDYSGVVSSHSWSDYTSYRRILRLGGVIGPAEGPGSHGGTPTAYAGEWRKVRALRDPRFYWGIGYGSDMNGFAPQSPARNGPNPVTYPFRSPIDPGVTLDRQRSGERVYELNRDGVAHYGLIPDWVEDLRRTVGDEIVDDLARGSEAYLQMWERAEGIRPTHCRGPRARFGRTGIPHVRLGAGPEAVLRRAGQPYERRRAWRWCVAGRTHERAQTVAVFTPGETVGLIASTARGHEARTVAGRRPGWVRPGTPARVLRGRTRPFGAGVRIRPAGRGTQLVFGVRRGRVRYVGVATREAARTRARLAAYLRLAGLR